MEQPNNKKEGKKLSIKLMFTDIEARNINKRNGKWNKNTGII